MFTWSSILLAVCSLIPLESIENQSSPENVCRGEFHEQNGVLRFTLQPPQESGDLFEVVVCHHFVVKSSGKGNIVLTLNFSRVGGSIWNFR